MWPTRRIRPVVVTSTRVVATHPGGLGKECIPHLREIMPEHFVSCHRAEELTLMGVAGRTSSCSLGVERGLQIWSGDTLGNPPRFRVVVLCSQKEVSIDEMPSVARHAGGDESSSDEEPSWLLRCYSKGGCNL